MKNLFTPRKFILSLVLVLAAVIAFAQAPNIHYSSPKVYPVGTAISPLAPTNTGGAVPVPILATLGHSNNPTGVAVDAAGNVYVANNGGNNILKFASGSGNPVVLGSGFSQPTGVAVDAAGNVFVADNGNSAIKEIPVGGGAIVVLGSGFNHPYGIALDPSGNIYLSDTGNNLIKEIPAGNGAPITLASGFNTPTGVAVDAAGNVYVTDRGNNAIKEIPAGGGSTVTLAPGNGNPNGVAVDAAGKIYFADTHNSSIKEIGAGSGVATIGSDFVHPQAVALDASGNVYIADSGNDAIKKSSPAYYTINHSLSPGLSFSANTGIISGMPAATSPATNYTVTATNSSGSGTANVNITVNRVQKPDISYSSPQVFYTNVAVSPVSPANSGGAVAPLTITTLASDVTAIGIAVDSAGNVYASSGSTVQKISIDGSNITTIATGFNNATGLAADAAGNIYVADYQNGAIKRIPAGGGPYVAIGPSFKSAFGITLDAAGNIYVTDRLNGTVVKMPPGGGTPVTIGSGFNNPTGIAVDAAGNVYVADRGNQQIKEIPVGGGSVITVAAGLKGLNGLVLDAGGNIYCDDDAVSVGISRIPAGGGGPVITFGQFHSPAGVAIDGFGNIYVGDNGSKELKLVSPGGYYITPALPAGLSLDMSTGVISGTTNVRSPAKNYRITAYNNGGLDNTMLNIAVVPYQLPSVSYQSPQVYTVGTAISPLSPTSSNVSVAGTWSMPVTIGAGLNNPIGVAVDRSGKVYVAENLKNDVKMIPLDGGTPVVVAAGGLNQPSGVAVDAAGNIYVTDSQNSRVREIPVGGGPIVTLGSGFNHPYGIALDASGNVYVTDVGTNSVKKIPAGNGTPITLGTGFNTPTGIAVDAAGNIYVTDRGNNAIKRMPPGGGSTFTLASGNGNPNGVAVDAAGNVYFADTNNSTIKEIPAGGGAPVNTTSGLHSPQGVAVDNAGALYVTNSNSVQLFNPGGYAIYPALPGGLSFNKNTGAISGTPTAVSPAKNYTVTAYNNSGSSSATVNIQVVPDSASLIHLTLSSGTLSPAFASGITSYTAYVSNATTSITETPTVALAGATVKVNGTTVASGSASGSIPLAVGPNTITTVVTSPNGSMTKTYTVTVNRLDVYLSNLKINNGAIPLNPAFIFSTNNYTASVPNATTSVKVTPKLAYTGSSVTVNGTLVASGTASGPIILAVGPNTITTVVTGADGTTTNTYTVTITRLSSNANLSNLVLSSGTLSPAFASGTTSYTASVNTASVTVTPTTSDATATVKVNGTTVASGTPSGSIALAIGSNTITTVVTAQDGTTTKTYTITVTRLSTNDYLTNLKINNGSVPLNPTFIYTTTSYTASVPNATASVKMLPGAADPNATIKVNGATVASGTASPDIPLSVGSNTVNTVVTAQDGTTTKTYTVTITRGAPMHAQNSVYQPVGVEKPIENPQLQTDGIVVHQGVSPNGDGMNDVLVVDGITNYPDNRLMIMNRSGQLIYEVKGYDNRSKVFDGHSNKTGAKQLPGTYFYSLDYMVNGVSKHKTGFIVLKY